MLATDSSPLQVQLCRMLAAWKLGGLSSSQELKGRGSAKNLRLKLGRVVLTSDHTPKVMMQPYSHLLSKMDLPEATRTIACRGRVQHVNSRR